MTQAIGLAVMTVLAYAVIAWAGLDLYWVEFGLMIVAVVGIGAIVARAGGNRPFLTAAAISFMTVLSIGFLVVAQWTLGPTLVRPEVLPPTTTLVLELVMFALMIGGISGAVALAVRGLRDWARTS